MCHFTLGDPLLLGPAGVPAFNDPLVGSWMDTNAKFAFALLAIQLVICLIMKKERLLLLPLCFEGFVGIGVLFHGPFKVGFSLPAAGWKTF